MSAEPSDEFIHKKRYVAGQRRECKKSLAKLKSSDIFVRSSRRFIKLARSIFLHNIFYVVFFSCIHFKIVILAFSRARHSHTWSAKLSKIETNLIIFLTLAQSAF